jgi:serine/threonine protein kinase
MIFRQLVQAVEHCHKSGIFHRDIKLDNILIDVNTHEVKLLDFDVSELAQYSPFKGNPGSPGYRSPEMYDGSIRYEGLPAAVYSMGVVLYDMIFYARGWELTDNRLPMPKVSLNCLDLISKMTASRPEDRLPFDKIRNHPWMQS